MTLNAKNFGLAGGIFWGLAMFVFTLIAVGTGYLTDFLNIMAGIYPGYSITPVGSIFGLVEGFLDGFVGLYIFAWLYNKLEKK
tara:strand:+ start:122 stop:370 length:249 start_codon:yes stop_codon:yes gene_type:complete